MRVPDFRLGTFSTGPEKPFPALVLQSPESHTSRIVSLRLLSPLLRERGLSLAGADSLLALLQDWQHNLETLVRLCAEAHPELLRISLPETAARIHAPLSAPRQIFCTVANYRSHVTETVVDVGVPPHTDGMDMDQRRAYAAKVITARLQSPPYVCFKLPSTVIGPLDALELPAHAQQVDWEIELGAVIGRPCRRVPREQAMAHVAGYVLVNDITARDLVRRADLPRLGTDWLRSKNGPGFLPTGPYLVPAPFVPDPYALRLSLHLNGETMQDELVSDMMFDIATQIEYVSAHAQLLPGDIICTGTPGGCGGHHGRFLQAGDIVEGSAPLLGAQRVTCI